MNNILIWTVDKYYFQSPITRFRSILFSYQRSKILVNIPSKTYFLKLARYRDRMAINSLRAPGISVIGYMQRTGAAHAILPGHSLESVPRASSSRFHRPFFLPVSFFPSVRCCVCVALPARPPSPSLAYRSRGRVNYEGLPAI